MAEAQPNSRLETFCDGVFAIALTLLIIDVKIPAPDAISTTRELWLALRHLVPSVLAFVLSFAIILITWVNHHAAFRLVNRSSAPFIYANGFLLLTVVFMPFPTALVGEYLLTDHVAPAVVIYNAVIAVQAVGWILLTGAALRGGLTKDEKSTLVMRHNRRNGYFALVVYSLLALVALWFPLVIAIVTTMLWAYWLAFGLRIGARATAGPRIH
jgi:TMEM175 potassium channel family protein